MSKSKYDRGHEIVCHIGLKWYLVENFSSCSPSDSLILMNALHFIIIIHLHLMSCFNFKRNQQYWNLFIQKNCWYMKKRTEIFAQAELLQEQVSKSATGLNIDCTCFKIKLIFILNLNYIWNSSYKMCLKMLQFMGQISPECI